MLKNDNYVLFRYSSCEMIIVMQYVYIMYITLYKHVISKGMVFPLSHCHTTFLSFFKKISDNPGDDFNTYMMIMVPSLQIRKSVVCTMYVQILQNYWW